MSATTVRFCIGISIWAASLIAALSISRLPGEWGHGVCGPWGCGPPLQALVACHLAWLIALGLPTLWVVRSHRVSVHRLRRIGGILLVLGVVGIAAITVYQRMAWWPAVSDWHHQFFWQRCGFVLVTSVDLPLLQLMILGAVLLGVRPTTRGTMPQGASPDYS